MEWTLGDGLRSDGELVAWAFAWKLLPLELSTFQTKASSAWAIKSSDESFFLHELLIARKRAFSCLSSQSFDETFYVWAKKSPSTWTNKISAESFPPHQRLFTTFFLSNFAILINFIFFKFSPNFIHNFWLTFYFSSLSMGFGEVWSNCTTLK